MIERRGSIGIFNFEKAIQAIRRLVAGRVRDGDRRKLSNEVEDKAEGPERGKLKHEIAQTVDRLRWRIEKTLNAARPPVQERLLLDRSEGNNGRPTAAFTENPPCPRDATSTSSWELTIASNGTSAWHFERHSPG